jgi:UDP-3-O-[3-hydroxymyristoyl] N-acetylglucosamine deacetylase
MFCRRNQHTIARSCRASGFGYWSGRDITIEFHPAEAGSGIVFVRTDLPGRPRIPALVAHRVAMPRRTNLTCDGASVEMIEHVMAALRGLEIDNCEIWADAAEMPGLDGSALPLVTALDEAGIVDQPERRARCVVKEPLRRGTDACWIESRPCCSGRTILQYALDYGPESPIGQQRLELVLTPESFRRDLAPCRTFMLESEAMALQQKGLGSRVTYRDVLVFGPRGPIDNNLRFPDECVRHKLLDLVGDLGLAGCDLAGRFSAYRSGHHLNTELVETLLAKQSQELKRCA